MPFFIGCNGGDEIENQAIDIRVVDKNDLELESIYQHRMILDEEGLMFYNILTNEIEYMFPFERDTHPLSRLIDLADYRGIFMSAESDSGLDQWVFVLDNQLNLVNQFELGEELLGNLIFSTMAYNDGELLVYYPDRGSVTDWQNIYKYNVQANEHTLLVDMEGVQIGIRGLHLSDQNQLILWGLQEDNDYIHYGIADLETKELELFYDTDFSLHDFRIEGKYLVISGVRNDLQFEVITIDLTNREKRISQLGEYSSMGVKLANDGRFILTAITDWWSESESQRTFIRVYDVFAENVLFEHEIRHDELELEADEMIWYVDFMFLAEGYYAVVLEIDLINPQSDTRRIQPIFFAIEELEE